MACMAARMACHGHTVMACMATHGQQWPAHHTGSIMACMATEAWPQRLPSSQGIVPRPKTADSVQRHWHQKKTQPLECTAELQNKQCNMPLRAAPSRRLRGPMGAPMGMSLASMGTAWSPMTLWAPGWTWPSWEPMARQWGAHGALWGLGVLQHTLRCPLTHPSEL